MINVTMNNNKYFYQTNKFFTGGGFRTIKNRTMPSCIIIACLEAFHSEESEEDMRIEGIKMHLLLLEKIHS